MKINHLVLAFVKSLTLLTKWQRVLPTENIVKINMGSDLTVADCWINIDSSIHALIIASFPDFIKKLVFRLTDVKTRLTKDEYINILKNHKFIFHNLEYGLPFPSNSAHCIYSSHLLEHLDKNRAMQLLKEAYRVLKSGGRIRLCVPDLEYAISLYQGGDKEGALSFFFDVGTGYFDTHKYMYDFELLTSILAEAGFSNVERCSYRNGEVPDISILDNRPIETLFVEATKNSSET